MPLAPRPHPAALPHGPIRELLPSIHFVTGTMAMAGPLPIRFSRSMTILREGDGLVLVNSVRLDDAGLAALDALGKVTDVIRLAGNHGIDDPFYRERYNAKVWAVAGQRYTAGFDTNAPNVYLEPDVTMDASTELPVAGGRLYLIQSKPTEGLLVLERHGGTIVAGDCLQNWAEPDAYFSFFGKAIMRVMGFIRPYNIGPAWLKQAKPPKAELRGILDLEFTNVIPAHGAPVIGDARGHYRPANRARQRVARASGRAAGETTLSSEATPVSSEASPVSSEATPVSSEATPVSSEATPVSSEASPVSSEASAVSSEATGLLSEASAVSSEATGVLSEATPVSSEATGLLSEAPRVLAEAAIASAEGRGRAAGSRPYRHRRAEPTPRGSACRAHEQAAVTAVVHGVRGDEPTGVGQPA